jgi:hypothetical protein
MWLRFCCCNGRTNTLLVVFGFCIFYLPNQLTTLRMVFLEKITVDQLVEKFPSFYGTRTFLNVHRSQPLDTVFSQMNPVYTLTPYI